MEMGRLESDESPFISGTILGGGPRRFGLPSSNSGLLFQFLSPEPPPLALFSLSFLGPHPVILLPDQTGLLQNHHLIHKVSELHLIDCPIHPPPVLPWLQV